MPSTECSRDLYALPPSLESLYRPLVVIRRPESLPTFVSWQRRSCILDELVKGCGRPSECRRIPLEQGRRHSLARMLAKKLNRARLIQTTYTLYRSIDYASSVHIGHAS